MFSRFFEIFWFLKYDPLTFLGIGKHQNMGNRVSNPKQNIWNRIREGLAKFLPKFTLLSSFYRDYSWNMEHILSWYILLLTTSHYLCNEMVTVERFELNDLPAGQTIISLTKTVDENFRDSGGGPKYAKVYQHRLMKVFYDGPIQVGIHRE